ncbi:MAG: amidohydrolase family protein [Gemmatimonadetes bacterium]|jgi:N-acyl-D-aspartate/D-glutamate deacylase|nr:amidohydrolase family protein [Gemmatimonadota bacterium]
MIDRRTTWIIPLALLLCATPRAVHAQAESSPYDVLITGGRVVDGTGNPWFLADVGIRDGRIAAVGRLALAGADATRVIDATGLVVAPGFIDLHTHSDGALLRDGTAQSKVRQGVTLDIAGESSSQGPRDGLTGGGGRGGVDADWTTFTGYFETLERQGISMNLISHVSYHQVRRVVKGFEESPATSAELDRMKQLTARSMEEGAWGLVTRFTSGGPQHPEEVLELAKVVASYGGNYTSHHGSEGYEQEKEIDFAIRVAEEAQIPVHLFHFKMRARENWGTIDRSIAQIEAARARGLDITANQYPYTAMFHGWSAFFPLWVREGGGERFSERLRDESLRERIKSDPDFIAWAQEHGWWEGIVLARASRPEVQQYEGMRVVEIAAALGVADPADVVIDLMAAEGGSISGVFHTMSEEDVRLIMRQPWVSVASDGSAINLEAAGVPHPRNYGTVPRVLGHYVRDEGVLGLEDAVRKMTSLPAQVLGLADRGQVREGFVADIAVFDPARIAETNSFENPKSYAIGIPYVLVNGTLVIDDGEHTGARPGRVLLGRGYKPGTPVSDGAGSR